ncbi:MAG TPA: class I SAM-dependent methyltransferase [Polyangiales bacterium]|nr:class I SAM-dependent methyltransferase [Polyangiales bacterium]
MSRSEHWNDVYTRKAATDVSWFQPEATLSLELIRAARLPPTGPILDVGAGASTLVDGLIADGHSDITLLDIAHSALATTRSRVGDARVQYEIGDITTWQAKRSYDLWHDRAVFHFLTSESDRDAYRTVLSRAVPRGGHVVIATFADDGPQRCSGLPVQRYSASELVNEFGSLLSPMDTRRQSHVTPSGAEQRFVFVRFKRI